MISIIRSFLKDKKLNYIYIGLIVILLLIVYVFIIIESYYKFYINETWGILEENRGYILEENIQETVNDLIKKIEIENVTKLDDGGYYVVLKNYDDTERFLSYLNNNNIIGYLKETTTQTELELFKNHIKLFAFFKYISLIITFIVVLLIFKAICSSEEKNISLLKAVGYKKRLILIILMLKCILLALVGIMMSCIIISLLKLVGFTADVMFFIYLRQLKILDFINISIVVFIPLIVVILYYSIKFKKINILGERSMLS